MSESETTPAPEASAAVESRALADMARVEAERTEAAELRDLADAFDLAIAEDRQAYPVLVLGANLHRAAIERLTRVTLRVLAAHGRQGVRVALLKRVYQAIEAPPRLAEFIERKLTVDGVGHASCGRLYFSASRDTWSKLAATRAE